MNMKLTDHGIPARQADELPGEARCPGPTMQEILARDVNPPPSVLTFEEPQYLGSADVSLERYYDQDFFDREIENVWKKTWQWVCREEHIPEAGDFYTYEIGPLSYLVVRQKDGSVKGFVNSCLHRTTKFKRGEGVGSGDDIRCPYHGWTWTNEGALKAVPCAWDFAHVDADEYGLPEVRVGSWGGFIFINPSHEGPDLLEFLAPMPEHFANWDLSRRAVGVHVAKELPCNWKTALEAFIESYHTMETHPQLLTGVGDANVQYDIHTDHITRFIAPSGTNSPHLDSPLSEQELVDMMMVGDRSVLSDMTVKDGETARTVMARYLRKAFGDKYGVDLSSYSDSEMIDTIEYHAFPNAVFFPGISIPMAYRFRPIGNNPDKSLFELLFLHPVPEGEELPEPPEPYRVKEDESYADAPGMDAAMGLIYDQDTENLRAQQAGYHASAKGTQTFGNYQEVRIRHFQNVIDKYVSGELPRTK